MEPEPGELVFFHGHPSWRSMLAFYAKGVLLSVLLGAAAGVLSRIANGHVQVGWVVAAVLVVFAVVLVIGVVRLLTVTYTITNRRLAIHTGLLSSDMHETRLERVQNVNSRQSLLERLLQVGTVDFDTAAGAEYDFRFHGVSDPRRIVRTVDRALQDLGRASGV